MEYLTDPELCRRIAELCSDPTRRFVGDWAQGHPSDWKPFTVINPDTGEYFTEDEAWDQIASLIVARHALRVVELRVPPGNVAYELVVELKNQAVELYIKVTLSKSGRHHFLGLKHQVFIALGRFEDALQIMSDRAIVSASGPIHELFNRSMAEWGYSGQIPTDLVQRVVEMSSPIETLQERDANYSQCLAVACWAIGLEDDAHAWLSDAKQKASSLKRADSQFSCWSYLKVPKSEFLEDLEKIERMIGGEKITPVFLRARNSLH